MTSRLHRPLLWAPWRIEYIRGPKPQRCIFCREGEPSESRDREDLVLLRRPSAFVMLNRYPFASGHLMVVPHTHASELDALSPEALSGLFELVRDTTAALRGALNTHGVNVGINLGSAAGAGIAEHLHVHVVPRWHGDTNFMPVMTDLRVMPEALDATYTFLRPHFEAL